MRITVELIDDIVCGIFNADGFQFAVNLDEAFDIPANTLVD